MRSPQKLEIVNMNCPRALVPSHQQELFGSNFSHEQEEEEDAKIQIYFKHSFSWCKDGVVIVSGEVYLG